MAGGAGPHKHSRGVYDTLSSWRGTKGETAMVGLALAMFISLFAFGDQILGWSDPGGKVQLGLFAAFLFGMVCGYRTRT